MDRLRELLDAIEKTREKLNNFYDDKDTEGLSEITLEMDELINEYNALQFDDANQFESTIKYIESEIRRCIIDFDIEGLEKASLKMLNISREYLSKIQDQE